MQDKKFALVFLVPTNAQGVKLICRVSNEQRAAVLGSPFDYPLSSRLDENDAIFIMDDVLVPWEDVFVYADIEKANNFFPRSGFLPRAMLHGCTRLAVKLDFITGLLIKATETAGTRGFRGVEANIGEVIAWRNTMWGLVGRDGEERRARGRAAAFCRRSEPAPAYHVLAPEAYVQIKHHDREDRRQQPDLSELACARLQDAGTAQISRPLCPRLGRGYRGRAGQADEAVVGCDRHRVRRAARALRDQLCRQPRGDPPFRAAARAQASGQAERWKAFADRCMAEYDLDGWTVPDLINPDDVSALGRKAP